MDQGVRCRPSDLPDFKKPPVTEVALSVQFERLPNLNSLQIGLFWHEFMERFPSAEQHTPLDPVFERFGVPTGPKGAKVRIEMTRVPPVPRSWFINEGGTQLVQVQPDRFAHNWRKIKPDNEYPRYETLIKTFESELQEFNSFVEKEKLGNLVPNQCEVTYVNHLEAGKGWNEFSELQNVLTLWQGTCGDGFLPQAEDARLALRYVIPDDDGKPIGRLHIAVEPAYRASDQKPLLVMTLTARGAPLGDGVKGVVTFMCLGRKWIVRGFTSVTKPEMHQIWERCDVE